MNTVYLLFVHANEDHGGIKVLGVYLDPCFARRLAFKYNQEQPYRCDCGYEYIYTVIERPVIPVTFFFSSEEPDGD